MGHLIQGIRISYGISEVLDLRVRDTNPNTLGKMKITLNLIILPHLVGCFLFQPSALQSNRILLKNELSCDRRGVDSQTRLFGAREDEIRRKIMKLKKQGKIKMDSSQNYDEAEVASGTTLDKLRRERQKNER